MEGQVALHRPIDHLPVEFFKGMANVAKQDQSAQRLTSTQILLQLFLPLILDAQGDLGEAIAGQVDQIALVGQGEEVD